MKDKNIRNFLALQKGLTAERDALRQRLAELDAALGIGAPSFPSKPSNPRPRTGRSGISMRDAIVAATKSGPLKVAALVPAMQQHGFVFRSSKPANSLGAYLYGPAGKQYFKKSKDGFSPR